jgi:hypothetical protein
MRLMLTSPPPLPPLIVLQIELIDMQHWLPRRSIRLPSATPSESQVALRTPTGARNTWELSATGIPRNCLFTSWQTGLIGEGIP